MRNWLIGAYIHEYEMQGQDRAAYGEKIISRLAAALKERKVPACESARLYSYVAAYRVYQQIQTAVSTEMFDDDKIAILRSLTGVSAKKPDSEIFRSLTGKSSLSGNLLLSRLFFTHLEILAAIDDPLKRAFYEAECIKGAWSVRELKRQIASLYFERSGLSQNQKKLSELVNDGAVRADPAQMIRDPYVFEFLGFRPSEALPESELEAAQIEKMQDFLQELGRGFCFEARQKRLLISGKHYFVDLVFYHRILKCHVLVELKVGAFSHEHLGQLNT